MTHRTITVVNVLSHTRRQKAGHRLEIFVEDKSDDQIAVLSSSYKNLTLIKSSNCVRRSVNILFVFALQLYSYVKHAKCLDFTVGYVTTCMVIVISECQIPIKIFQYKYLNTYIMKFVVQAAGVADRITVLVPSP